ncbi:hypothetical protein AC480_00765 [miscellaneous Crenarchaeota group archaeon SMTZ1-55]|nr:MAG: hypothetical protein AC480_00765 [miscellaneous Crenarchaeota group archaeon SMTZ1-55]
MTRRQRRRLPKKTRRGLNTLRVLRSLARLKAPHVEEGTPRRLSSPHASHVFPRSPHGAHPHPSNTP